MSFVTKATSNGVHGVRESQFFLFLTFCKNVWLGVGEKTGWRQETSISSGWDGRGEEPRL